MITMIAMRVPRIPMVHLPMVSVLPPELHPATLARASLQPR